MGDRIIVTVAPEGEGLADALALLDAAGVEVLRIDGLKLHGEGNAGNVIASGCEDGVAIFDPSADPPTARCVADLPRPRRAAGSASF